MIRQNKKNTTKLPKRVQLAPMSRQVRNEMYLGPSYTLHNREYFLPPPSTLQPLIDTKAGELELWPAHASCRDGSSEVMMLTKDKRIALFDDYLNNKLEMTPKPRFLKQLDHFLQKELRTTNCTEVKPSELRLQAYRQVFDSLIKNFKTYRFIFSAIKNEYEMMLNHQKLQIRELKPLQGTLFVYSEQLTEMTEQYLLEEPTEIALLRKEHSDQAMSLEMMTEEMKELQVQVDDMKHTLEEAYHKARNETDARVLLVAQVIALRYMPRYKLYSVINENPIIRRAFRKWKQKIGYN